MADLSFIQRTLPATTLWRGVTYGNGLFVAVAYNSAIAATSPDGVDWTQRTLPVVARWHSVAYGNGMFIAVAISPSTIAATSPDGITWTQRTLPVNANWRSVAYGNGLFVVVDQGDYDGSSLAVTSPDGITWTQRTLPYAQWLSVAYGNGLFVAIGTFSNIAATSPDGITWTQRTLPVFTYWHSITYGNGLFVAVASNTAYAAVSSDGVAWTLYVLPISGYWRSVTYGNGLFVSVGQSSTKVIVSSDNGATWTQPVLPVSAAWSSIAYGNNTFVTIAENSAIAATAASAPAVTPPDYGDETDAFDPDAAWPATDYVTPTESDGGDKGSADGSGSNTVLELVREFSAKVKRAVRIVDSKTIAMVNPNEVMPGGLLQADADGMYHTQSRSYTATEQVLQQRTGAQRLEIKAGVVTDDIRIVTCGWRIPGRLPVHDLDPSPVKRVSMTFTPQAFSAEVEFHVPDPPLSVRRAFF